VPNPMRFSLKPRPKKVRRPTQPIRIAKQDDGRFQVEGYGIWYTYWRDPYHLMLTVPWWGFACIISGTYILLNLLFALLYLLGGDCLTGARHGSFEDAFFFSVHTLGSIGYGVIAPKTTYANIIVTFEAITSLLAIAVVTGLSFARFSKPKARILFSQYAVIAPHNGLPTLIFRMANERRNLILETQIRVYLLRNEQTQEGEFVYRVHNLNLIRDRTPALALSWTIYSPITLGSPLHGMNPEDLVAAHVQLIVSMSGLDETVAYTVTARHAYGAGQILFDHRLVDVMGQLETGDRYFDRTHFHSVEPIPSTPSQITSSQTNRQQS
jgi:inward rectifier potassium channel